MKNIQLSAEMTKAILDGEKTQVRKAIKKFYDISLEDTKKHPLSFADTPKDLEFKELHGFGKVCPLFYSKSKDKFYCGENIKYSVGEKIWVKEPARLTGVGLGKLCFEFEFTADNTKAGIITPYKYLEYDEEIEDISTAKCPKWLNENNERNMIQNGCIQEMARLYLVNIGTKIERLQDIAYEDMQKEGYSEVAMNSIGGLNWFQKSWNKATQKGYKWEDNPFVYVYDFKRVER